MDEIKPASQTRWISNKETPIKSFRAIPADARKVLEAKSQKDVPDLVNPLVKNWSRGVLRFLARFQY